MTTPKNVIGQGDHHAPATGLLAQLPVRTLIQGVGTDVVAAVALVVYETASEGSVDWRLMGALVIKTSMMTVASYIMKRVKPPAL